MAAIVVIAVRASTCSRSSSLPSMTPAETLRAADQAGDEAAVRALLAGLSEAERPDLIPVTRELVAAACSRASPRSVTWGRCCWRPTASCPSRRSASWAGERTICRTGSRSSFADVRRSGCPDRRVLARRGWRPGVARPCDCWSGTARSPDRTGPRTPSRCSLPRATVQRPTWSPTTPVSLRSKRGDCSRSKAAARIASPTTRSSSATPGAPSSGSSQRPRHRPASGCWMSALPPLRVTSRRIAPVGFLGSTSRWHPRTRNVPSEPRRTCDCSEARSARRFRSRSRRLRESRGPVTWRRTSARQDRAGPRRRVGGHRQGRTGYRGARWRRLARCRATGRVGRDRRPGECVAGGPASRDHAHRATGAGSDEAVAQAVAGRLADVAGSQRMAATALLARLGDGPEW